MNMALNEEQHGSERLDLVLLTQSCERGNPLSFSTHVACRPQLV